METLQSVASDPTRALDGLADFISRSIDNARIVEVPFYHLEFAQVFPPDLYPAMLAALPVSEDYRPMHGRSKGNDMADGTHTRVKMDLFPEYIRHLPPKK